MLKSHQVFLYCVDGTNLVRQFWGYGGPEFREQEESDCVTLVESFAALCQSLAGSVQVELFFDGEGRGWQRPVRLPENLRVRFSWEEPADTLILDRIRARAFGHEGGVTVVTADGELGRRARAEGGRWLAVSARDGLERVLRSIEARFSK